jgi:protein-S-isoprenylcysteine O-methyltransferase Ste14
MGKQAQAGGSGSNVKLWSQGAARLLVVLFLVAAAIFGGAGTVDFTRGWILLAIFGGTVLFNLTFILLKNPELFRERWKRQQGTKSFDKIFGVVYLLSAFAMLAFAGLDVVRYGWTSMSWSFVYAGAGLHLLGLIPLLWSMLTNPHLETTVRIQTDRDHRVVSDGPYRYVRHPMYVGIIFMFLGWAMILGSWVSLAIASFITVLFIIRTGLEDQTLRNELDGYEAFCTRTRYRLIPGIW